MISINKYRKNILVKDIEVAFESVKHNEWIEFFDYWEIGENISKNNEITFKGLKF